MALFRTQQPAGGEKVERAQAHLIVEQQLAIINRVLIVLLPGLLQGCKRPPIQDIHLRQSLAIIPALLCSRWRSQHARTLEERLMQYRLSLQQASMQSTATYTLLPLVGTDSCTLE